MVTQAGGKGLSDETMEVEANAKAWFLIFVYLYLLPLDALIDLFGINSQTHYAHVILMVNPLTVASMVSSSNPVSG